ncbi:MAG TPA: C25 family cysteine peptidase, partial [Thermodesulfovibrionales bacterium]|nr:C25 family cysteine peptidase [Thermodesulfovibrionales bacterium]
MSRLDNMNLSAQKWLGGKIVLHTAIQEGRDVIIIVTKALWDRSIDSCLKILCSDLRNEGFSVVIATVDAHIGSGWVRNFLQEMRNSNERGPSQFLIIVGQIDVPWFGFRNLNWKNVPPFQNDPDHTEYFPSDFYYADLTGSWNNHFPLHANPQSECYGALAWNELWDSLGKPYLSREHYQPASADYVMWFREELGYDPTGTNWGWELSSGDKAHNRICAYPDMAVGRIDPTPITAIGWDGAQHNPIVDLDLQEQLIFAYFSRNHQYRT